MLKRYAGILLSPTAPTEGGRISVPAGKGPLDRAVLAQTVERMESPETPTTEDSPNAPAQGAEGSPQDPNKGDAAGAAGDEAAVEPSDSDGSVLSQSGDQTDEGGEKPEAEAVLPPELEALPEDVREGLLEMAKEVAAGKTSFGELKRGHKIGNKLGQQIQELQRQLEDLRQSKNGADNGERGSELQPMPGQVSKLNNARDVEAREQRLQAVLDFCEDNPSGGRFGREEFSAEEVTQMKRDARNELRWLPKRAQQIQAEQQLRVNQRKFQADFQRDYSWSKDPDSAQSTAVQERLEQAPWLKAFASPEYSAHIYNIGELAAQGELVARKSVKDAVPIVQRLLKLVPWLPGVLKSPEFANGARPAAAKGKVPSGKLTSGGGGGAAAPRAGAGKSIAAAKEKIGRERSVDGLAALLEAQDGPGQQ